MNQTQTGVAVDGTRTPDAAAYAVVLATALAVFLIAAAIARHRSRFESRPPERFLRMLFAALFFAAGLTSSMIVEAVRMQVLVTWAIMTAVVSFAVVTAIALVLFAIADFWLGLLRPRRNRRWLVAAMLFFALYAVAAMTFSLWIGGFGLALLLDPSLLALAVTASAAGLIWWACLPAAERNPARAFD